MEEIIDECETIYKYVNWLNFVKNNKLTDEQILKYHTHINDYTPTSFYTRWWSIISYQTHVSEDTLSQFWHEMNTERNIKLLIFKKKLSVEFIKNHFADIKNAGVYYTFSFTNKWYSDLEISEIKNMFELYSDLV